jgi:hypothetical protein
VAAPSDHPAYNSRHVPWDLVKSVIVRCNSMSLDDRPHRIMRHVVVAIAG